MGVQTHPIPHPLSSRMRGPIPLPPLKCHSERSTAESRKLAAIPPAPHPLSSRMRGPIFAPTSHQPAPAGATIPVALPLPSHMSFRAQRSGAEESRCHPTLTLALAPS